MTEANAPSERDLRGLLGLRTLLGDQSNSLGSCPPGREILAAYCRDYILAFLQAARSRWRFGFDRPFRDVVEEIADWEVSLLLWVRPDTNGKSHLAFLVKGLFACLGRPGFAVDPITTLLATDDLALLLALRKLLRIRAHQGAVRLWKQEHPQEALLLRALKVRLRHTAGIRIQWDARGQLVMGDSSDLRTRSLDQEDLAAALCRPSTALNPREIVRALRACLVPNGQHGGYCYFLDLVRVVHRIRMKLLEIDGSGTGAVPREDRMRLSRSGLPMDLWVQKVRNNLEETARGILANDGGDASHETREAWVTIALERTLRYWGMGDPAREHLSQAKLTRQLIREAESVAGLAKHQGAIDYLIRRLRGRIKRQGKRLAQPLWHRWMETTRRS